MYIPFNSGKDYHKYPFGAVQNETEVTFRIILPRNFCCTGARIIIEKDGEYEKKIPMSWDCMQGDSEEWWKIQITFDEIGLYFYHFEYDSNFGVSGIYSNAGGQDGVLSGSGESWQLTVYDKNFKTPDWIKGGIFYQIFPDRFCFSGEEKANVPSDRIFRTDYSNEPYWKPDENGKTLNNDYFCGDLKGIENKLPYLASLGVSCVYLNPIFEAHSNHRYDTGNYEKIDPLLGTEKDFESLCQKGEELGVKIILDGVFSHTGSDSKYFNKEGRYNTLGAYESKNSEYYKWYKFKEWPDDYECWWGVKILPEIIEETPEFIEYISGKEGIAKRWLSHGAGGWRLDVADELPDEFLDSFRKSVKEQNPDALIIGEVWEDASNKSSYGKRRRYLQGQQLDSVMNYPFADAIIDFVRNGTAENFNKAVVKITENYPKPVIDVLMNNIGTHDTQRAITALAGESCEYKDRQWQSGRFLTAEQKELGKILLKEAAVLQFTLPGVPCIYYGDEAGMEGYKDPFNRGFYPWGNEDKELVEFYKALGRLRRENREFFDGRYSTVSATLGCVAFTRGENILVIANSNSHSIKYYFPQEWNNCQKIFGDGYVAENYAEIAEHTALIFKKR
ncbi:MAG: glycoside hydrolase family 13 protein [Clostridia bacterium]|nr:glycoside hydrolase family 13 protein [Clostridia bacterium]